MQTDQRRKADTLNLRVDPALKAEFMAATEAENKPVAEVLRDFMRSYVKRARRKEVCGRGPQAVTACGQLCRRVGSYELDPGRKRGIVLNVKRGDLVTVAVSGDYGKPRPALIIQSDAFDALGSVTVAPLTSDIYEAPLLRVTIHPGKETGLHKASQVMVDKITTVPRVKIGQRIGSVETSTLRAINRALKGFLDLE